MFARRFAARRRSPSDAWHVTDIDPRRQQLILQDLTVPYDYLVVATGATHSYFGKDAWARFAPGLKGVDDATAIRRRVLEAFERAEIASSEVERQRLLNFVIVGAGPTGVELARADRSRRLKPGTVLLREYQGERHTVTVVAKGYVWREATYASLSIIARAITGTAWNGPRFFGLRIDKGTPRFHGIPPTRRQERLRGDTWQEPGHGRPP